MKLKLSTMMDKDKSNVTDELLRRMIDLSRENTALINSMQKSQAFYQQEQVRAKRKARRDAYLVPLIPLLGVLLSIAVGWHWYSKQDYNTFLQERFNIMYKQKEGLENKLETIIEKRNNLMEAMAKMRIAIASYHRYCKRVTNIRNQYKCSHDLFVADSNLIVSELDSKGIFNRRAEKQIIKFLQLVDVDRNFIYSRKSTDTFLKNQQKICFYYITIDVDRLSNNLRKINIEIDSIENLLYEKSPL